MVTTNPRRRRESTTVASKPQSFKERMESAKSVTQAADDGYLDVVKDDRLDYCGLPMLVNKWTIKSEDATYNGRTHCRVWAEVAVSDSPEPRKIRFWDMGGRLGDQLLEFERCGTLRDVVGMLDAREYELRNGEAGYEYFLAELPPDVPSDSPSSTDEPPY